MNAVLEPEDDNRCLVCRSTFEMHLEFPHGINYVDLPVWAPGWILAEEDELHMPMLDVKRCNNFVGKLI